MRNYRIQVALTAEEKEHIEQLKEEYGYYSLSQTMNRSGEIAGEYFKRSHYCFSM